MEARISLRAVWFALKRRHQAVQEWNQQAVAVSHFDLKNRPILGAISHFEISRLRQSIWHGLYIMWKFKNLAGNFDF